MLYYLNSFVITDLNIHLQHTFSHSAFIASQPTKQCKSGELANHVSASK